MHASIARLSRVLAAAAAAVALGATSCTQFLQELGLKDNDPLSYELLGLLAPCGNLPVLAGALGTQTVPASGACLVGNVFVPGGATLTVNAGTTIYGTSGSALFVLAGGKLNAVGSASQPVVFTSAQPAGQRTSGDWGGIVMIGRASTNAGVRRTEGTDPQNYGGSTSNNDADSSGTLQYVRIEFGGFPVTVGNELNGLSLYAVGTGTTIDHIQVHMAKDDGIEFFGGAVNVSRALVTGESDDGFDIDYGYHGKMQFLIGQKYSDGSAGLGSTDPRGLEWNGRGQNGDALQPPYAQNGTVAVANVTIIGPQPALPAGLQVSRFRVGMAGTLAHFIAWDYGGGAAASCIDPDSSIGFRQGYVQSASWPTCPAGPASVNVLVGQTTQPYVTAATSSGGVANYQPVGGLPATGATLKSAAPFAGDSFFTDNSTFGGMLSGDNWTSGWTNFSDR
ncbi:MAG: hypothetical protein K1X75_06680 [Leptospirales bacterium]|nr:hypothetical protein [Leptospirales bacterium]